MEVLFFGLVAVVKVAVKLVASAYLSAAFLALTEKKLDIVGDSTPGILVLLTSFSILFFALLSLVF